MVIMLLKARPRRKAYQKKPNGISLHQLELVDTHPGGDASRIDYVAFGSKILDPYYVCLDLYNFVDQGTRYRTCMRSGIHIFTKQIHDEAFGEIVTSMEEMTMATQL